MLKWKHKRIKKPATILLLTVGFLMHGQENIRLSDHPKISLLTCSPCNDEVYMLYGHTAIRIQDTVIAENFTRTQDYVFNYGLFDFSKPNFIYRFAKGETDYKLGVHDFASFLHEYQMRGSEVCEQELNLNPAESNALREALIINARPENCVYRYNFFFDNCATRPASIIEQAVNGKTAYAETQKDESFRDLINRCTRNHPWVTFGCDLALGSPTDRTMTLRESFFIPERLKEAFAEAWIINPDGSKRPLVKETRILTENIEGLTNDSFFTPFVYSVLFFVLILLLTIIEIRKRAYFRWLDCLLFFIAGTAGCILFFLSFISVHPSTWPNISLAWLHPFHWVGVILFAVKKLNKAAYWYHFINFAALLTLLASLFFIPQHINMAFIPLIICLMMRSGRYLTRKKKRYFE